MKRSTSDDSDDELLFSKLSKRRKESAREEIKTSIINNCKTLSNIAHTDTEVSVGKNSNQNTNTKSSPKALSVANVQLRRTGRKKVNKAQKKNKPTPFKTPEKSKAAPQHCPICQAPYGCLIAESPGWHRQQCSLLEIKRKKDCPQGENCNSEILSHYERYNHEKLAKLRTRQDKESRENVAKKLFQNNSAEELECEANRKDTCIANTTIILSSDDEEVACVLDIKEPDKSHSIEKVPSDDNATEIDILKETVIKSREEGEDNEKISTFESEMYRNKVKENEPGLVEETATPSSQSSAITILEDSKSQEDRMNTLSQSCSSTKSRYSVLDELPSYQQISPLQLSQGGEEKDALADNIEDNYFVEEEITKTLPEVKEVEEKKSESSDSDIDEEELEEIMQSYVNKCERLLKEKEESKEEDSDKEQEAIMLDKNKVEDRSKEEGEKEKVDEKKLENNLEESEHIDSQNFHNKSTKQSSIISFFAKKDIERKNTNAQNSTKTVSFNKKPKSQSVSKEVRYETKNSSKTVVKRCPFYKKIPGTKFTVDAFKYGLIPDCDAYFLTHFHYDHYGGLTKTFEGTIYCSKITANLLLLKIHVNVDKIKVLNLNEEYIVQGCSVTFLEANHCPGAVLILFKTSNGCCMLHTGDFRACPEMEEYEPIKNIQIDELYLDTTYCKPTYSFPPQQFIINLVVDICLNLNDGKTVFVCGSYTVGKEKIFRAISEAFNSKIYVTRDKFNILKCYDNEALTESLTMNKFEALVHVLPLFDVRRSDKMESYLKSLSTKFNRLVSFEPTGWTFEKKLNFKELKPVFNKNNILQYAVPYSEHSSYEELKRFVQYTKPKKIIPTVNVGKPESRLEMNNIFKRWLS